MQPCIKFVQPNYVYTIRRKLACGICFSLFVERAQRCLATHGQPACFIGAIRLEARKCSIMGMGLFGNNIVDNSNLIC